MSLPSESLKPSSKRDGAIKEEDDDEANESIDREIMQDLDNYRREEEIKRLKDRTEEAGSGSDNELSLCPSSPRLKGYLEQSNAIEGVKTERFRGKQSGTHSHDSLRKQNKGDSPAERLEQEMGLFEINKDQFLGVSNETNE